MELPRQPTATFSQFKRSNGLPLRAKWKLPGELGLLGATSASCEIPSPRASLPGTIMRRAASGIWNFGPAGIIFIAEVAGGSRGEIISTLSNGGENRSNDLGRSRPFPTRKSAKRLIRAGRPAGQPILHPNCGRQSRVAQFVRGGLSLDSSKRSRIVGRYMPKRTFRLGKANNWGNPQWYILSPGIRMTPGENG